MSGCLAPLRAFAPWAAQLVDRQHRVVDAVDAAERETQMLAVVLAADATAWTGSDADRL